MCLYTAESVNLKYDGGDFVTSAVKPIAVMKRYEMKYILDPVQKELIMAKLVGHMKPDKYGLTSIASLYYDTPDCILIRNSIEKPQFKEKIRLRSYGLAKENSPVFLELKRKAFGIVYKRRISTDIQTVDSFFKRGTDTFDDSQISREITAFRDYYGTLVPSCLIIYDRIAYYETNGDLRLTIDQNPRYRMKELDLTRSMEGISLLDDGYSILEIKVQQSMPLWLAKILSDGRIYKSSFSKYGEAYVRQIKKLK